MKNIILIVAFLIGFGPCYEAYSQDKPSGKMSFGFNIGQYQRDFGLGVNITSPYFLHEYVAVRLRANFMFYEHPQNLEMTWTPYTNFTLGLIGVGGTISDFARLYGEGGFILIIPDDEFSSSSSDLGGYGLFGFEFFMNPHINYYIELGGVGSGAQADKIALKPIYSNGFLVQTGFRIVL